MLRVALLFMGIVFAATPARLHADAAWKHSGEFYLLTTPEGANLPTTAEVRDFPVLVRLQQDFFDFRQAHAKGADIRFFTDAGEKLAYQIEEWDADRGHASVWIRVPLIKGNERQRLRMRWGNTDATSESNGKSVFNTTNHYASVWHMNGPVSDEVGTLVMKDTGTTSTPGVVGSARHFAGKQGLFGGDQITTYPAWANAHSTEAWFRISQPNATLIGWGNEGGGRGSKVRMQLRSPPHIHIDSDFSDVRGQVRVALGEWVHVLHTYDGTTGKIYINGQLDATAKPTLNIKTPSRLWLGGWYHNYDFIGDLDEVRISRVARSADWAHLQFENQKPLQTLVGPLVQAGHEFELPSTPVTLAEGTQKTFNAKANGAQKTYWSIVRNGRETVVAVDRLAYTLAAGRVAGPEQWTLRFKAIYPTEVKTQAIPITIAEAIPEPLFTLTAPTTWDGRTLIEVVPNVRNLKEMQAKGAGSVHYAWRVDGLATIHEVTPDRLLLKRAMNSGPLTVTLAMNNGGHATEQATTLHVREPAHDAWVERLPSKDEKPEEGQFYARNAQGVGLLHYNGTLANPADTIFLRLYANDQLQETFTQQPTADRGYAFAVKLKPGLIQYRIEFGTKTAGVEAVQHKVGNLVCGDAFLIAGQSNAVATDFGKEEPTFRSEWIRTFGTMSGNPKGLALWGQAVHRSRDAEKLQVGYWGMELARRLVETHKMPICLINGAVGGTRIDQQQRNNAQPEDPSTIYGRLLWRVRHAKLTHGIRGVIWHQGENDQGADGPSGGYGWETYRALFIALAASWKQDYPNVQHFYLFQIWPKSCAMGINGSDNRLREVQRQLPTAFAHLSIMSTLGIDPPGGCHFPAAGYAEFARLLAPLIERDHYGVVPRTSITPPNLKHAEYQPQRKQVVLEFDQAIAWDNKLVGQFWLDGAKGLVRSGTVEGTKLVLQLDTDRLPKTITYLDSQAWSQATLLRGTNGIAALTFCEVPLRTPK